MTSSYSASTELDAVNQILSSVGQAPVTTLDQQNPEVSIVLSTLREVNRQVQSEGWTFNTEKHKTLNRNSQTNRILFPPDALSVDANKDAHRDGYHIVRRTLTLSGTTSAFLYDMHRHKYEFETDLICDIVYLVDFDDTPPIVQSYITARASRLASVKLVGDSEIYNLLQEQEAQTRLALMEYEANQGDFSMFGFREGQNSYTSYQPFQNLMR